MRHIHFFEYNVPAENHRTGKTDFYLDVVVEWGGSFYSSGKPIVYTKFVDLQNNLLMSVNDWMKVILDCDKIGEQHFAEIAKQERINQARAILQIEENPIILRGVIAEA